jgi:hypothetical protein
MCGVVSHPRPLMWVADHPNGGGQATHFIFHIFLFCFKFKIFLKKLYGYEIGGLANFVCIRLVVP